MKGRIRKHTIPKKEDDLLDQKINRLFSSPFDHQHTIFRVISDVMILLDFRYNGVWFKVA